MLATLGFLMIITFMVLIMTRRLSAMIALIVVPIVFALFGGFGKDMGPMALEGIKSVAPTGIMILFAILFFGIMIDAGVFDPIINTILKVVKGDPVKIAIGTAVLALLISLDGDGTTTYMITISAMLPLYKRIGMKPLVLAGIAVSASGVMNLLPWGGPTARAMTALNLEMGDIFTPVIPSMIGGVLFVLFMAYTLGKKERKRTGVLEINYGTEAMAAATTADESLKRPKLILINYLLTIILLVALIREVLPTTVLFMIGFAIAITMNYPNLKEQKERVMHYADNALSVVSMVFAAGVFTGILSGTKMVDAMANVVITHIPDALGSHFAIITAIISAPFTFFMSNDAFYYGVLPLLAKAASGYGIDPAMIGRASLLGLPVHLLSPLVPSTYLLVGMVGEDFGSLQRTFLKWACGATAVMILVALIFSIIPI
ncbi:citrate:proton symporter [Rummeliibacillus sp. G93]|uniref:CitMHS family transporter n=1 Tax=Rummeliibacillus TaxID=648802 RepID=UPI00116C14CD|nr:MULTISPECIES: citrate:proton symporter [Rummeliibacillus]MBB5171201.1 CitMHS family citrate-Mg2+:H+ or citrate-Ca2+:H+ symporter [Rummeliibacillus stabekisii]UQW97403.1 citrate:proton symporter [Rummeliibacillus sp. G93]GEL06094.1 citrate transporter [Rummeliibacillus stabekisii]